MFNIGDVVELDLNADINIGWNNADDELAFIGTMGLLPNAPYTIEGFTDEGEDFLGDKLPRLVKLKENQWDWSEERFKLLEPINLENE